MDWSGVDCDIFTSSLNSHSDVRSIVEQMMQCYISVICSLRVNIVKQNFNFGWTIHLKGGRITNIIEYMRCCESLTGLSLRIKLISKVTNQCLKDILEITSRLSHRQCGCYTENQWPYDTRTITKCKSKLSVNYQTHIHKLNRPLIKTFQGCRHTQREGWSDNTPNTNSLL